MHNGTLTASRAFTTLSLIEIITTPLTLLLQALPSITTSLACLDRIQEYLKSPDRLDSRAADGGSPWSTLNGKSEAAFKESFPSEAAICFKEASISYKMNDFENLILESISWIVPQASITMVVGPPGSGKSSLLKAILGETNVEGEVYVRPGPIAYCDQSPWVPNESVKDCIVGMGDATFDSVWYDEVVYACALGEDEDLCSFTNESSQKAVGSRGMTLSEGQKHRLVSSLWSLVNLFSSN